MKIEICPVCGNQIEYIELTTFPPVPVKQCPSCGWRWEGKPEKIEYAPIEEETTMMIEDLEKALQYFVIAVPESEEQAKAYFWARKALTALRSMPEAGEPLNLEQLREMDGQPAYWPEDESWGIVSVDSAGKWAGKPFFKGRKQEVNFEYDIESRGMEVYAYPPAHIDRSKWEPCEFCGDFEIGDSKIYPKNGFNFYAGFYKQTAVDEFNEEETEDVRYCPKCGRPLTEEAWAELERRLMK